MVEIEVVVGASGPRQFRDQFQVAARHLVVGRLRIHAPQALELLNGRFSNEMAKAFAQRLRSDRGNDSERIVRRAFLLTMGRPPSEAERELSLTFLDDQPLEEFALALFNLNGFLYVR